MKEIGLTQGYVALVDDEDYEYLNKWKWCAHIHRLRKIVYAKRGFVNSNGKYTAMLMHRQIMEVSSELQVDHIDHNGLNNQKSNLRKCTNQENHMNMGVRQVGTSPYIGVTKYIAKGVIKIQAKITYNYKTIHLGYFNTEEDAARAYDEAAKIYFGEFANLNFK